MTAMRHLPATHCTNVLYSLLFFSSLDLFSLPSFIFFFLFKACRSSSVLTVVVDMGDNTDSDVVVEVAVILVTRSRPGRDRSVTGSSDNCWS